ncbi:MAG TPA: AarF/ABC1/UbiB kinase family protein [Baekduia sp.]|uniref:AarF/ABC1/UbiB kinase family protein n=1 Tax=Baekduia sp. TaxID=2600305 RepID=UPI002B79A84A|nr:AarF/ABC1/UbiB kinase family protein [Baekduia sp.]HMJ35026.1 AarF/ABC1/UbiB kinase family protein [Baekduia sp.]
MAAAPILPPALRGLLEAGAALLRRSSSGRVGLARAADVVAPDALPTAMARLPAQLEAAHRDATVPLPFKDVERVLKAAWRAAPGKVLDDLDPEPLAVTPAAQVHRGAHDGRAVAIKILRPGLAASVRSDLALLDVLAAPLRQVFGAMDAGAILREVRETALDELDLEHEASSQRQVKRLLRGIEGLVVPAPDMELSGETVLVGELLDGPTLKDALPADPGAVARTLVAAHVTAARGGIALTDLRPGHVVLLADGRVGLLGAGVTRPADRDRVAGALDALCRLREGDQEGFAAAVADGLGLLPASAALKAYALTGAIAGELLMGKARLDGPALASAAEHALDHLGGGLALAADVTPQPGDLAAARSVGQVAAVLSRLGATEDWGALMLAAG